ncbi:hypothetical protein HDU87_003712 [Geranomyces variabilis]|uniref:Uncharacterized protein n=1 Tax=Geranomyces variabilis TaxID=109894 RepID=A0AAD5TLH8_9FUNG|nr:hypothetical protein HDU87_003712 [Geranomyces variabilis]
MATTAAPPVVSTSTLVNRWNALKATLVSKAPGTAAALVSSVFDRDACVVYVPTAAGATGVPALEVFFRKVADHNEIVTDEKIVNRVISSSAIAEESILTIVHDSPIEWLLPDVKPTKRRVLIPMSTYVLFSPEGKLKAMRVYWDQGSVMKQIGLLPNSMFCKANNSETVPPVLGTRIVDRLVDAHAEPNLIVKEHWEDAPSAGTPSGKAHGDTCATRAQNHEPAHGILPSGDDDQELLHDAGARRLARASTGSLKSRFDEDAPIHNHKNPVAPSAGRNSEMADILENKADANPTVRSSTRIHHAQAAKTSDIFHTEPSPERPTTRQSRYNNNHHLAVAAEDDSAPAAGIKHRANTSSSSTSRRDPNWSSSSLNNNDDHDTQPAPPLITGKKIFRPADTPARHSRHEDAVVDYSTVGKKHFTNVLAAGENHFDFAPTGEKPPLTAAAAGTTDTEFAIPLLHTGRKHSAMANRDNNIFGYDKRPSETVVVEPVARTGRSGKRDPNARSTEHDVNVVRPSSRVLGPPGGKQSFSFA